MSCPRHDNNAVDRGLQDAPLAHTTLADRWHRLRCPSCREAFAAEQRITRGLAYMQAETLPETSLNRMLTALGLPDLPALTSADRARLKAQLGRLLLLIGLILFVTTLAQPELIGEKAIQNLWFGNTSPNALQTARLWLCLGLCWYVKPLFAILAQAGTRDRQGRQTWLAAGALGAAGCWFLLGFLHTTVTLLFLLVGLSAMLALASTVMGGILVEQGQRMGATGRLGALHAAGIFLARLAGAGVVGLLGEETLSRTAPFCALLLTGFALLSWRLLREEQSRLVPILIFGRLAWPSASHSADENTSGVCHSQDTSTRRRKWLGSFWCPKDTGPQANQRRGLARRHRQTTPEFTPQDTNMPVLTQAGTRVPVQPDTVKTGHSVTGQFRSLFQAKNVWGAAGIAFLIYIAPNFASLQHTENVRLGFSALAQNGLDFVGGACGLAGVAGYLVLCRRLSLQTLLKAGIVCNGIGTLLYLGYASVWTAFVIEGANGLLSALVFAMLFDLAIRAIPRGQTMLGYAFLTGVIALASRLSNVFGSWLTVQAGWHFAQVVSLSALLSLPALVLVAYLPAALLNRREGTIVEPESVLVPARSGVPSYS